MVGVSLTSLAKFLDYDSRYYAAPTYVMIAAVPFSGSIFGAVLSSAAVYLALVGADSVFGSAAAAAAEAWKARRRPWNVCSIIDINIGALRATGAGAGAGAGTGT